MSPDTYQKLASRTECDQLSALERMNTLWKIRLNHAVVGLAGEVGELASSWEKAAYYGQSYDAEHLKEELGDCLWYVALACNAMGISLADVMEANLRKLAVRYPERYSDVRAAEQGRDRAAEARAVAGVDSAA